MSFACAHHYVTILEHLSIERCIRICICICELCAIAHCVRIVVLLVFVVKIVCCEKKYGSNDAETACRGLTCELKSKQPDDGCELNRKCVVVTFARALSHSHAYIPSEWRTEYMPHTYTHTNNNVQFVPCVWTILKTVCKRTQHGHNVYEVWQLSFN